MLGRRALTILLLLLPVIAGAWADNFVGIIDYKPSTFRESAERPFFFSIGKNVKFGYSISENASAVFGKGNSNRGADDVYPSPDETKAAIASGGKLYLAEPGKVARLVLEPVDNYAAKRLRQDDVFYKIPMLQWSADSQSIFIARDRKRKISEQNFSPDAALVRIELGNSIAIAEVVPDFRSMHYVLFGNDSVCFDYAPGDGSVVWRCSQRGKVQAVAQFEESRVMLDDGSAIMGKPFVSYYGNIHASEIWLTRFGFSFKNLEGGYEGFFASGSSHPIFRIKTGTNIKGQPVDGVSQAGCMVLPGGRFALIDVWHDNFKGQLLVDGSAGLYRELPRETRVYSSLNSSNYSNFRLTLRSGPEFLPMAELREK